MAAAAASTGVSLRNILFPTEFSSCSETALSFGAALARHFETTLYAVTVVPEEITDYVQPPDPFYLLHSAERKMANMAGLAVLEGIRHREYVKQGIVMEVLLDLIDRLEIGLLVTGTHGRSGVKRLLRGSVAEEIASSAPCPVLTVGPLVAPLAATQPVVQRILYATGWVHRSAKALAFAAWLAEREHAHLTLLHVWKLPSEVHDGHVQSESMVTTTHLAQTLSPQIPASVETEFIVETGVPRDQILKVAERQRADLIVMGPHHTSFASASTHLPWVTPHEVICHARCPVLTVRE
jgi:nucleotide-binding universal stress UspA family protein